MGRLFGATPNKAPEKLAVFGVIEDLHSRRAIGWAVSNRMKRDLAIRALKMAIGFRPRPKGCICYPAGDCYEIGQEGTTRIVDRNTIYTIVK